MPDHFHFVWMGILDESDQIKASMHLRTRLNSVLQRVGFQLQLQGYDHVFKGQGTHTNGV